MKTGHYSASYDTSSMCHVDVYSMICKHIFTLQWSQCRQNTQNTLFSS